MRPEIYKANGYDIALVQRLLQHSSASIHSGDTLALSLNALWML